MAAFVGETSLVLACASAILGIIALVLGQRHHREDWIRWGRTAALGVFGLVSLAVLMLEIALVRGDFRLLYVASNISRTTPLPFRIIGLWGALEGSILFWQWLQAFFLALVTLAYRRRYPELMPFVLAVMLGISGFFLLLMLGPANPFVTLSSPPPDGRGLNPLLQNHPLMAVHPPFLYFGYVGFSVPYAFAMGTLLAGHLKDEWMAITRRWTLLAWTFLTGGIFLGARWSYDVLGWGGYWAWDPVENASFMPWLLGTAFLHSVMVQQRTELLRIWNLVLIILTFLLTIFGTFLTRSGVVASVHSFTQSLIGPLFLTFLTFVLIFSLAVLLRRLPEVRDKGTFSSYLSRETFLLLNNVVLLTMAFTVMLGTVFPLVMEAITGQTITVGPPFFNRLFVPLGILLVLLMGVGTLLRWGRSGQSDLLRLVGVLGSAGVLAGVLAAGGIRGSLTLLALGVVAFMALAQLLEFYRGTVAMRAATNAGPMGAFLALFSSNRQRYCGYLTHLGLAVTIVGIVSSLSYRVEVERHLDIGDRFGIGSYTLRYDGLEVRRQLDKLVIAARVTVLTPAHAIAASAGVPDSSLVLVPSENFYPTARAPVPTPAVRSSWRDDLYLVLMSFDPDSRGVVIRAIVSPLVAWIWAGGLVMMVGGAVNVWPTFRRR